MFVNLRMTDTGLESHYQPELLLRSRKVSCCMSKTLNGYMALKDKFLFGASVFTAQ